MQSRGVGFKAFELWALNGCWNPRVMPRLRSEAHGSKFLRVHNDEVRTVSIENAAEIKVK